MKTRENAIKLKVLNPLGKARIKKRNASRLDTLEGKTICEAFRQHSTAATGTAWRASETFPVIRELLQKRIPSLRIVPYSDFPSELGSSEYPYWAPMDKIVELLRAKGCDAVLVGNGG